MSRIRCESAAFQYLRFFIAHCQKRTYSVGVQTYDTMSFVYMPSEANDDANDQSTNNNITTDNNTVAQSGNDEINKTEKETEPGYRYVAMYYATANVKISTRSKLINLSTFISSTGGNLGLFVGFSFISGFFYIYGLLENRENFRFMNMFQ